MICDCVTADLWIVVVSFDAHSVRNWGGTLNMPPEVGILKTYHTYLSQQAYSIRSGLLNVTVISQYIINRLLFPSYQTLTALSSHVTTKRFFTGDTDCVSTDSKGETFIQRKWNIKKFEHWRETHQTILSALSAYQLLVCSHFTSNKYFCQYVQYFHLYPWLSLCAVGLGRSTYLPIRHY